MMLGINIDTFYEIMLKAEKLKIGVSRVVRNMIFKWHKAGAPFDESELPRNSPKEHNIYTNRQDEEKIRGILEKTGLYHWQMVEAARIWEKTGGNINESI